MSSTKEFNFARLKFPLSERLMRIKEILHSEESSQSLQQKSFIAYWAQISKPTPNNSSVNGDGEVNHFVDVIKINWLDLTANVEIFGPNAVKRRLPLVELFGPIQVCDDDDDEVEADINDAKIALDHLHFFLTNLWLPWDEVEDDDDGQSDWVEHHLENRFNIFKSFAENSKDNDVYVRLGRLAKEYIKAMATIKQIRDDNCDEELEPGDLVLLHELEKRREDIKREADILENPTLRLAFDLSRLEKKMLYHNSSIRCGRLNCIVWTGGSFDEMSNFMAKVRDLSGFEPAASTVVCDSLQEAISKCLPNDFIYLPPGVHTITDVSDLKEGGVSIVGLNLVDTVVQFDENNFGDTFGLSVAGGTFENISISATTSTENGVLVMHGGTTFLNKVHVSGFRTGVKVMTGAALVARRCEIFDCNVGIVIENGSCVQATDVEISHSKSGIVIKNRSGNNIKFERVNSRCDQNVIVVDPSSCDEDDDVFGESDLLSKTIVVDSSLGETRLVRSLND